MQIALLHDITNLVVKVMVMATMELDRRCGTRSSLFLLIFWLIVLLGGFFVLLSQAAVQQWQVSLIKLDIVNSVMYMHIEYIMITSASHTVTSFVNLCL